ncbi:MAG: dihydropyrimidinase [Dehalococcoidia bacterium]
MDLVIRNGTVVTAAGSARAHVGVEGGRVTQVGGRIERAPREIDATGMLVLPGGVDPHVHLTSVGTSGPHQRADDLYTGTRAAAAGGVTTIIDFAYQDRGSDLRSAVDRVLKAGAEQCVIDYGFHPVVYDPSDAAQADIPQLVAEGFPSLKIFTVTASFDRRVPEYLRVLEAIGGSGGLAMLHCEDRAMIDFCTHNLLEQGKTGVEHYPESRPREAEVSGTERALHLADLAGAPAYVVHVSCNAAVDVTRRARRTGQRVYVETRPIYLYLTDDRYSLPGTQGNLFVGQPPLRDQTDVDALWHALASGDVQVVATDHVGWMAETKLDPRHTFATVQAGMSNLETLLPMLFSEGVRTGRISIERFVQLISANPARIMGLYPRKGTIAPGSDADLVIWDPERPRTIHAPEMHSASDFDVFEGFSVTGWPVMTLSRGEVVFENGRPSEAAGRGRLAARERFTPL